MSQSNLELSEPMARFSDGELAVPAWDALVRPAPPASERRPRAALALVRAPAAAPVAAPRGRCEAAFQQMLAEATAYAGAALSESAWRE